MTSSQSSSPFTFRSDDRTELPDIDGVCCKAIEIYSLSSLELDWRPCMVDSKIAFRALARLLIQILSRNPSTKGTSHHRLVDHSQLAILGWLHDTTQSSRTATLHRYCEPRRRTNHELLGHYPFM
ncbi:hypothetical protein PM082_002174 [Marasmius tenuissimus]|nr:hypothetical protein PM082_002174 [Marasmius tenuissimus]